MIRESALLTKQARNLLTSKDDPSLMNTHCLYIHVVLDAGHSANDPVCNKRTLNEFCVTRDTHARIDELLTVGCI